MIWTLQIKLLSGRWAEIGLGGDHRAECLVDHGELAPSRFSPNELT
jgi:hypothetical protein